MNVDADAEALFREAREHARRRRRRRRWAAAGVAALATATVVETVLDGDSTTVETAPDKPVQFASSEQILQRSPYLGVACPTPNSVACDRVGLSVALRRPAQSVRATIGRRSFLLDARAPGPKPTGVRRAFEGFLQPAGLREAGPLRVPADSRARWVGQGRVRPTVRLEIDYPDGSQRATEVRVRLAAGWG